jgi:hypothetical protein
MMPTAACLLLLCAPIAEPAAARDGELPRLWDELCSTDPARAQRAIDALVANPASTLVWLDEHLRPVPRPDERRIARLLADLDDPRFPVRRKAADDLAAAAEAAESSLRRALDQGPSLEVRKAIQRMLECLKNNRLYPPPERLRTARAVEVLEEIGSQEARRLLTTLGAGAPEAMLTVDARGALKRLAPSSAA